MTSISIKTGRVAYSQSVTIARAEKAYAIPPLEGEERHVPLPADWSPQASGIGRHWNRVRKKQTMLYMQVNAMLKRRMYMYRRFWLRRSRSKAMLNLRAHVVTV